MSYKLRMRSRLAAAVLICLTAFILVARRVDAGERAPSVVVPVKDALAKMKKAKAPKGAIGTVQFYADVLDGKSVEFYFQDFSNAGAVDEGIATELQKTSCGALSAEKLKAASAILTEYGDALSPEVRGYVLGQQQKPDQAAPLLLKAIEAMQPLDHCVSTHPDDFGHHTARVGAWMDCYEKLAPKADRKKLEAVKKKLMDCAVESMGTVG